MAWVAFMVGNAHWTAVQQGLPRVRFDDESKWSACELVGFAFIQQDSFLSRVLNGLMNFLGVVLLQTDGRGKEGQIPDSFQHLHLLLVRGQMPWHTRHELNGLKGKGFVDVLDAHVAELVQPGAPQGH